jgi:DNA-binding transcriptional regulator/RsmH inhibitor MraZ
MMILSNYVRAESFPVKALKSIDFKNRIILNDPSDNREMKVSNCEEYQSLKEKGFVYETNIFGYPKSDSEKNSYNIANSNQLNQTQNHLNKVIFQIISIKMNFINFFQTP